jgi:osmotically-inducible protein OsmY
MSIPAGDVQANALKTRVQSQLSKMGPFFSRVTVKLEGATVELAGVVQSPYEKELAEFMVRQVSGVSGVENRLTALRPISSLVGPSEA